MEESSNKKKKVEERTCNGQRIPDDQPLLLSGGIMRDYQLKGYQWMATLYENGINGEYRGTKSSGDNQGRKNEEAGRYLCPI